MAIDLTELAVLLRVSGIRHHVDVEEGVIRVVWVTRSFENLRGERHAILRIEPTCAGRVCRVTLARVADCGERAAASCERLARVAAHEPLVGVEYDPLKADLRLAAAAWVEHREFAPTELLAMIRGVIGAAEALVERAGDREAA